MPRIQGYSIKGHRCYGKHDWGSRGRTNVIGGLLDSTLIAVGLLTGSVDTSVFTCWVDTLDLFRNSFIVTPNYKCQQLN